jgi:hypothetical protein
VSEPLSITEKPLQHIGPKQVLETGSQKASTD